MTSSCWPCCVAPFRAPCGVAFWPILCFCCLVCFLSACAPQPQVPAPPEQELFVSLSDSLRSKALEYENRGDLRQALLRWGILQTLNPHDKEISRKG